MTDVQENVVLACVSYVARKVFADNAVPVRRVRLVEELLYVVRVVLLGLVFVDGLVDHADHVSFHGRARR